MTQSAFQTLVQFQQAHINHMTYTQMIETTDIVSQPCYYII